MRRLRFLLLFTACAFVANPALRAAGPPPGYLFAHMTKEDYGRLYYSISLDGLNWTVLNGRHRILPSYRGHPDLCLGLDHRYYLVGNVDRDDDPRIQLWVSPDLIHWETYGEPFVADLSSVPGVRSVGGFHGAPKLFLDRAQARYVLTWHSSTEVKGATHPWIYWDNMRTYCSVSTDLHTWSPARRLLPFDFGQIDTILRRWGDRYYAIFKDERAPDPTWPTGKAIRIASAPTMDGPWTEPGPRLTPNWCEAPALLPRPDGLGWYLYADRYVPHQMYETLTAPSLDGPWIGVKASMTPDAKHGGMIPITRAVYDALLAAFPPSP